MTTATKPKSPKDLWDKAQAKKTMSAAGVPVIRGNEGVLANAAEAKAIANEMGISDFTIKKALAEFKGVERRFTKTGEVDGISIIDD